MAVTYVAADESVAAHYGALLGKLNDALSKHGVRGRIVRVIRLRLQSNEYSWPSYAPPELEVRGADRQVRATVTIVRGHSDLNFCVRPVGDPLHYLFPFDERPQVLALLIGRARDWQAAW